MPQKLSVLFGTLLLIILSSCNQKKEPVVAWEESEIVTVLGSEELDNIPFIERVTLDKELHYDKYTLNDTYPYRETTRSFQWNKIKQLLATTDSLRSLHSTKWAVLNNRKDSKGIPPLAKNNKINKYKDDIDQYGIERSQAIPLYLPENLSTPERYNYDGALICITEETNGYYRVKTTNFEGEYLIPQRYVRKLENDMPFSSVIVVDRKFQNISTYEKEGGIWYIRSMNPCTTGGNSNKYQRPTPTGLFILQQKAAKMWYMQDLKPNELDGYAPWASRFCCGAWIHGVPVKLPATEIIEYSRTLGTVPLSHMCIRNVSSHAEYIYDNFPQWETLIYVIE